MNIHHIQKTYTTILQRNKTRSEKMEQTQAVLYIPVHESPSFPCIHPSPFTIFKCLLCCCHCLVNISQRGRRYTGYYLGKGSIVLAQKEHWDAECYSFLPNFLTGYKQILNILNCGSCHGRARLQKAEKQLQWQNLEHTAGTQIPQAFFFKARCIVPLDLNLSFHM